MRQIYQTGMAGFASWLANDPTGVGLYQSLSPAMADAAACLEPYDSGETSQLPSDARGSSVVASRVASLVPQALSALPAQTRPAARAALNTQLSRAAAGQPPLNVGLLELGATRIKLGQTCLYFGASTLSGGDLLLVLAGLALVVGLIVFHRKK